MGAGGLTLDAAVEQLLAAAALDVAVRDKLLGSGRLEDGYDAEMRAVHEANADLIIRIIAEFGWPDTERFGDAGAQAAWLIVQHAIGRPDLQRTALGKMRAANIAPSLCAMLEDRIAFFEGRPQRFGTQFDRNDAGELVPWTIADPEQVDALRAEAALRPLAEHAADLRARAGPPPADPSAKRRAAEQWLAETGWRSPADDSLASACRRD